MLTAAIIILHSTFSAVLPSKILLTLFMTDAEIIASIFRYHVVLLNGIYKTRWITEKKSEQINFWSRYHFNRCRSFVQIFLSRNFRIWTLIFSTFFRISYFSTQEDYFLSMRLNLIELSKFKYFDSFILSLSRIFHITPSIITCRRKFINPNSSFTFFFAKFYDRLI